MLTQRKLRKVVILMGAALCLWGFSGLPGDAQASSRNITIAQGIDMNSWDPYGHSATGNYAMWKHVMEPLIGYDYVNRKYVGVLAESWKGEDSGWTFTLRRGIKFHDGSDFTARDVKFSFETVKGKKQAPNLKFIKAIEVVDDHTVKLVTNEPFSPALSRLKQIVIVSQQAYKQYGDDATHHPIGTGPFKFVEWVKGSHFVAKRNEAYWGGPVKIDQVIWKPIPEDAARVTALEMGAADIATSIPPHEVDRLKNKPGVKVQGVRSMRSIHIGLPTRFEPFKNRLVRQAMNYAVDLDSLIKYVFEGKAYRGIGVSGPNAFGHNPAIKPYPYDPEKAKSLLAQAGYPNGFEVDFYSPSGRYVKDREAAQAVAGQLAKVGIKAKVITQEWSVFWSSVMGGKYPMFLFGGFNEEDPDIFLSLYFETGFTKRLEYSNPDVDRLISEQRVTFDAEKRETLLEELNKIIYEDAPTILLWHPQDLYGVSERLIWNPSPDEEVSVWDASVRE